MSPASGWEASTDCHGTKRLTLTLTSDDAKRMDPAQLAMAARHRVWRRAMTLFEAFAIGAATLLGCVVALVLVVAVIEWWFRGPRPPRRERLSREEAHDAILGDPTKRRP